mmetsp:Transcript_135652/g.377822  ORF Transcript_135652/g.377822 Transcript_135652/m.377822 type:complete len:244 (-) Transcript_135652:111-842(-)
MSTSMRAFSRMSFGSLELATSIGPPAVRPARNSSMILLGSVIRFLRRSTRSFGMLSLSGCRTRSQYAASMSLLANSASNLFPASETSRVYLDCLPAPNFFVSRMTSCSMRSSLSCVIPARLQSSNRTDDASVETRTNCTTSCTVSALRFMFAFALRTCSCVGKLGVSRELPVRSTSLMGKAEVRVGSRPLSMPNLPTAFSIRVSRSSVRSRFASDNLPDDIDLLNTSRESRATSSVPHILRTL